MAYLERFRHKKTIEQPPADAPKPSTVPQKLHLKKSFPVLHRDCGPWGDCVDLSEEHLIVDVFVRDDGVWQAGATWPKRIWLREVGRLPWTPEE